MVIQELDYMKESNHHRSLRKGAQKAVHYINTQLASKHPQFKGQWSEDKRMLFESKRICFCLYSGQTVLEASTQDLSSVNPDDGILFCCMQLSQQGKTTVSIEVIILQLLYYLLKIFYICRFYCQMM